ncbi:hypothetical protein MROS_0537 [Melioribacter roseus P3M-2]|uniref:Uncharacterized protein n=1 Tax=Melioribacter roseus (strain DSM 23840 / JCM 17771 / VKM B-2668 / P3M-2) TaxID=1191523 RepID=I6Z3Q8_MELRP|nr:hypothetical protein [Melioribacter roseus]AFN73780.1 hypothetical protein MROS_0537 [Melioribacter roseus P3M-2]
MENKEQNEQRFLTLLSVGKTISTIGWIIVLVAALIIFSSFKSCIDNRHFDFNGEFIWGFLIATIGYFIVAQGQIISCFVSIENNTYKISELMANLIDEISGKENNRLHKI